MRKSRLLSTLLFVAMSIAPKSLFAGKPPQTFNVISSFAGLGIDTNPIFRLQSDQLGPYVSSSTVESIIQGVGDWELQTLGGSPRTILFDFREPVPNSAPGGTDPTPPFSYGLMNGRLICKGGAYGTDINLMYGVNSFGNCALFPSFSYGGFTYRIDMDGVNFSTGTQPALVTCLRVDSANLCNQWRIEPSAIQADGQRKNIGRLLRVVQKPKRIETDLGKFYFSFTIDLVKP